jgi:hypothetical protein
MDGFLGLGIAAVCAEALSAYLVARGQAIDTTLSSVVNMDIHAQADRRGHLDATASRLH